MITRMGAGALALATAFGGACGFADKKQLADRIREAPALMDAAGTARGAVFLSARVIKPERVPAGFQRALVADTAAVLDIDFPRRTATGSLPAPDDDRQLVARQMWSGPILYQRRAATDGRPWVKLDLRNLYEDREELQASAFGANTLGPLVLVDLLAGALTGSVKRVGQQNLGGVPTTHYRVNFAFDKAFDDAPDDLREGVEAALALMGTAYDGVSKGEVWLDADGLPRRIRVAVRASRGRNQVVELRYKLDLFGFGLDATVRLPKQGEIERVNSVSELTAGASR